MIDLLESRRLLSSTLAANGTLTVISTGRLFRMTMMRLDSDTSQSVKA